jgi:organic hydroperoxide reductase OsmC/OhrA
MLKLPLKSLRARVVAHEVVEGSFVAETIRGACTLVETVYEIESDGDSQKIAVLLRNAHNVCIVGNTVRNNVEHRNRFVVNGRDFAPEEYPLQGQSRL